MTERQKRAQRKYHESPHGQAHMKAYWASPEYKARKKAYETEKRLDPVEKARRIALRTAASKRYRASHPEAVTRTKLKTRLMYKFGLTVEDVERMFADQGGRCAACGDPISLVKDDPNYREIDHNHAQDDDKGNCPKEAVRGLLCYSCNSAAGYVKDSPGRARSRAAYLEGYVV